MQLPINKYPEKGQRGVVLLVVTVVLILIGFAMMLGVGDFKASDAQDRMERTQARQRFLVSQLSSYVQRENSLPCPARPANRNTATFGVSDCTFNNRQQGIVPFRTLGLSEYDVLDGWGRFMTYRVSPALTTNNDGNTVNDSGRIIYERCRRLNWYIGSPAATPVQVNPDKARFCCPPSDGPYNTSTDLIVSLSSFGPAINGIARTNAARMGDMDDDSVGYTDLADNNVESMFAFAIISHGANGAGAYVPRADATIQNLPQSASTDEAENSNNDIRVVDRPMVLVPGGNYFDDIVIWRTQLTIMSELGNVSCYLPWR